MKFDQVRREYKRTLWGEELDNERYCRPSLELDFLHQYDGKRYPCKNCSEEYEENHIIQTNKGQYCPQCFDDVFSSNETENG